MGLSLQSAPPSKSRAEDASTAQSGLHPCSLSLTFQHRKQSAAGALEAEGLLSFGESPCISILSSVCMGFRVRGGEIVSNLSYEHGFLWF